MSSIIDLARVSCDLHFFDGHADIASFHAGAVLAGWSLEDIFDVTCEAMESCECFDDVGEVLYNYCTDESWA